LINFKIIEQKNRQYKGNYLRKALLATVSKDWMQGYYCNDSKRAIYEGREDLKDYDGKGKDAEDDTNSGNTSNYEISRKSKPDPEILPPLDVLKAGTRIAASGRSGFPNQINNAVVFPSVLRALLDTRAKGLDEDMLVAASYAIASLVERPHLNEDYIIPKVNDPRILPIVVRTLKEAIKSHINNYNNDMILQKT
jgi:hypothetical protein